MSTNKATKKKAKGGSRRTALKDLGPRKGQTKAVRGGAVDAFIWFEKKPTYPG